MQRWIWMSMVAGLLGCASAQPNVAIPGRPPALFSPQLASDRSVVVGAVLSTWSDTAGLHLVVLDKVGRAFRLLLPAQTGRYTGSGMTMRASGDTVTAWCRGAGADLVADSIRVEGGPS